MTAKRSLNFGTPSGKRQKSQPTMVVYRGLKPEMKFFTTTLTHSTSTSTSVSIAAPSQGTAVNQRVGAKIKVWRIEYVVAQASGNPVRVDLLINNLAGATISSTYDSEVDRNNVALIKTRFHTSGSNNSSLGSYVSHKLPYGVICKYGGSAGTTINTNQIVAHVTTPSSTTVTGYFRIWFTDN